MIDRLRQDLRFAFRNLRGNPAFALTAVCILALGIAGNTAMFTVIRAVLLAPLPYHDPERLVRVSGGATPGRFEEMKAAARSFTEVGAFTGEENVTLTGIAEPEVLKAARVSAGFLRILGIDPILGRSFLPEEDSPGGAPAAMISSELWRRRFEENPRIAGKTIVLSGVTYTIAGVLPPRFHFPSPGLDVWLTKPLEWGPMPPKSRPMSPFLTMFGRLKPGLSVEQTSAEMKVIQRQYTMAHPAMFDAKPKEPARAIPMKEELVANVRAMLWMLFGAAGFVLLIACANVASLLLARAAARSREFAVRAALGATRARLIGQLLVESVLVSFAGGILGAVVAGWSLRAIPHMTAFNLPRAEEIHLDWVALGFTTALSMLTGVAFGLAPSIGAARTDLARVLRASGESRSTGTPRRVLGGLTLRGLLVVGQVALSIVLLIGAALLMESIAHLRGADPGFNPANLLTLRISLPLSRYDTEQKRAAFHEELLHRIRSSPGVVNATSAMALPMSGYAGTPVQDSSKPPLKLNERLIATVSSVSPGYFQTLDIRLRRGREFTEHDRAGAPRVAIIDENMARHFWPAYPAGEDPIGKRLLIGALNPQPLEIVGIVANVHQNIENTGWPESVYLCFAQSPPSSAMLAIRTQSDPLRFTRAVREHAQALDADQPISAVQTMDALVDAELGQRHVIVSLLGSFAGIALLLALTGIYGLIAYAVAQRTHEIGIRRALGARHGDILWLLVGQGLGLAVAGVAFGVGGALALTKVMKDLLYHVSATDAGTFAGIGMLFLLVALAASYVPARRATLIDPMAALR